MKFKVGVIASLLLAYIASSVLMFAQPVLAANAAPVHRTTFEQFAGHFKFAADATDTGEDTCSVEAGGIAWVVCPFIREMNTIVQKLYTNVVRPLLFVQPFDQSNNNAVKQVWAAFRNLADALFVLAFIYIIFANVFSYNMNVYTVRRMLPRLVVAVIMVQFSFLIASLIVDLGNILGVGIQGFISDVIKGLGKRDANNTVIGSVFTGLNLFVTNTLGVLLIGTAVATFGVALSFLTAAGAIIGLLAAALTLIIRQLLISIMVVLSPLAFVAWILPNTEKWFKFWWENLTKLVMMFPIISLIMSIASLFAVVSYTQTGAVGTINQLAASLFPVVAFMLIPTTFAIAGRLFGNVTNFVSRPAGNAQRSLKGSQMRRNMQEDQKLKLANYESKGGARGFMAGASQGRLPGRRNLLFKKSAGSEFRYQRSQSASTDEMAKRLAMDSSISTNDLVKFVNGDKVTNATLKSMEGNTNGIAAVHGMLAKKGLYELDTVKNLNKNQKLSEEQKDSIFNHVKRTANAELMEENLVLGYASTRRAKDENGNMQTLVTEDENGNAAINSLAVDNETRKLIGRQTAKVTGQKLAKMSKEGIQTLAQFQIGTDDEIRSGNARSAASFITSSAIEGTTAPTVAAGMSDIQRGAIYQIRHNLDNSAKIAVRTNYDDSLNDGLRIEYLKDKEGRVINDKLTGKPIEDKVLVRLRPEGPRGDIKKAISNPDPFFNDYRATVFQQTQTDMPIDPPREKPKNAPTDAASTIIPDDGGIVEPGATEDHEDNDNA